jgi:hypothetical protein
VVGLTSVARRATHDGGRKQPRRERHARGQTRGVTEGFALGFGWLEFLLLLSVLAAFVLRRRG